MPFGSHVIGDVENCLAECFPFHDQLDNFVLRSGYSQAQLDAARTRAEERNKRSDRGYSRAPKRFVAQEILRHLGEQGTDGDVVVAAIITGLNKGNFPEATPDGRDALRRLNALRIAETEEAAKKRADDARRRREAEQAEETARAEMRAAREQFLHQFMALARMEDAQARGYALEKFLNEYFEHEGLSPRGSFKLVGEQIDGSLSWNVRTHLVEARWVKEPVAGLGFGAFIYKIEGKTADTRGLMGSINGYSEEAIKGLKGKGALRFICIDGTHLMRSLQPGFTFAKLLEILWRHADETGEAYLPVSTRAFQERAAR